jgi:hypothetical protein
MADPKTEPLDITDWFVGQLILNGKTARKMGNMTWKDYVPVWGLARTKSLLDWFKKQVKSGAPWDFKSNVLKPYRESGATFAGKHYRFDMPGNFHYGYIGAAAGIRTWLLKHAAGQAQLDAGTSAREYWCTDFDDPVDQAYILLGVKLYDTKGLSITSSDVATMLDKFNPQTCGKLSGGWFEKILDAKFPKTK